MATLDDVQARRAVFALGEPGGMDEALFGNHPDRRDFQNLIVDAQRVQGVFKPREPTPKVATFAAIVLAGQVEGELDG